MITISNEILSDDEKELINRIYTESGVRLYNMSYNILKSHADAEDAVAQAFIKIIEHIQKIKNLPECKIVPFCVIIVKNTALDIIRKRNHNIALEDADNLKDESTTNNIWKYMDRVQLFGAMEKMRDDEKYLLNLHFAHGLNFKEIGQIMGVTEETAKKRNQRALKKLRVLFEEETGNAIRV